MSDFKRLARTLRDAGAEFVIIGGFAAIANGASYITEDLDLCYRRDPENYRRICTALQPFHPTLRGAPAGLPFKFDPRTLSSGLNFTLTTDLGDLDLLGEVSGLGFYDDVKKQALELPLFDCSLWILSIPGLIAAKKAAGRNKDLMLLPELQAMLALRGQPPPISI